MKIIIGVLVALAISLVGFVGYVFVDSRETPGSSPATASSSAGIVTISRGERVKLEDHVAPGVITIFDFTADW